MKYFVSYAWMHSGLRSPGFGYTFIISSEPMDSERAVEKVATEIGDRVGATVVILNFQALTS